MKYVVASYASGYRILKLNGTTYYPFAKTTSERDAKAIAGALNAEDTKEAFGL